MARPKLVDPKAGLLKQHGCLNPRPESVTDPGFGLDEFFDARDLVQVKYEMLRRVRVEGASIAASAAAFGFSRPTYYQTAASYESQGLTGLIHAKPGPRGAHKLSEEVLDFVEAALESGEAPGSAHLALLIKVRFGRDVHPRSIERAMDRRKEKKTGEEKAVVRRQ